MVLKQFLSGIFVKAITGFDDTMVHIPLASAITRTRKGKIAFALGILSAITLAIIFAAAFASLIKQIPHFRYIFATLIILLALSIYFEIPKSKTKPKIKKKIQTISTQRFLKLIGIGFIAAFITVIDDTIAYASVLTSKLSTIPWTVAGIYTTTAIELIAIIYFSKQISKLKYKKEISAIGLIILAILILTGIL
ncbi:hypothetical protein CMI47_03480 [Candidatus Pacearchaeota archaeon]|nr:hypothetical protein [Candidatus Pacearchaeota archaeon]|tara:strand:- start:815 stop:1396 length:582 start_codon:yes stop_codon:yes gene_type:complete